MAEIFISHARADRDYAKRLADYLEEHGLSVWRDTGLEPGEVSGDEIESRIDEARHVIVLWSKASVASQALLDEALDAARQKKLVAVCVGGCEPPLGFRRYRTHALNTWPGDLAAVLAAVGGAKPAFKADWAGAKSAQDFFDSGRAAARARDHQRAIFDYTEAIRRKPNFAAAYARRAGAYAMTGDTDRAIADCNEALRLDPDNADAYRNRGVAYGLRGDHVLAIADYGHAIRLKPGDADLYNNRGAALFSMGDYARAISDYSHALRLNPRHGVAAANKALAEMELAKARKK
jgi:tetratricopeptide (TPR) repeat protein